MFRFASLPMLGPRLWWILRVAAAACFIGHGAFGLRRKQEWIPFFGVLGISPDDAYVLMPLIGAVDIAVGLAVLLRPSRVLLLYMTAWALWTAALRPLSGDTVFELFERAGNYGVPLTLLFLLGPVRWGAWRDLTSVPAVPPLTPDRAALLRRSLGWTTALLLLGHGALGALAGKALLGAHFEAIGWPAASAAAAGWMEIALAILVLVRPRPGLLVAVVLWKVGTEMLYPIAGAPLWEFIERGGSYGAPLALALLVTRPVPAVVSRRVGAVSRLAALLQVVFGPLAAPAPAQQAPSDSGLVTALRGGGYVLAFRHTQTDSAMDSGPDRASQRNLNEQGVRDAQAIGAAIRALAIPIGEVRANPMYRNRETAEHAFGRATVDSNLGSEGARTMADAGSALRALLGAPVPSGTNRAIVTRIGVLSGAFEGHGVQRLEMGDCIVVQPVDGGRFRVVRHLSVADWGRLRHTLQR